MRKRLLEAVSKIENAVVKGNRHMRAPKRMELMKMSNKILNIAESLR